MKEFFRLLKNYLIPYKGKIAFNVVFNFFGALFGVFSFVTMIPALKILFGLEEKVTGYLPIALADQSFKEIAAALKHNAYSLISTISDERGAASALVFIGIVLIVMVFFKTGFTYLGSYFMIYVRTGIVRDIRRRIFGKTTVLPLSFYSEERKGDIIARMTGDVSEIEVSVVQSLDMFFKNPIIIIVSVVTMIIMSWQLTLFVFILFPLAGYIIGRIGKSLKKSSMAGQTKLGEMISTIEETLSGLRIIKAFNAEEKINKRFNNENEDYRRIMKNLMRRKQLAHPVSEFLGTVVIVIVMWYGGNLILNDQSRLEPASFLVYLVVFYSIINPSKAFSQAFYSIQKGLASIERINLILNAVSNITEIKEPKPVSTFKNSIQYNDVFFKYNTDLVLKHINISVKKGETIALIGQSGSGKSTMVDLLPRFYDVFKGNILIDEVDLREYSLFDLRELFGIVNQEPILFNDTFYNNIAFGVDNTTEQEVINAAKVAHAHEFIMETEDGYYSNIGDRGGKLSGGQRQRISIARAVLKNPPILILDEATSALDSESEKLVQDALNNLMKNRTSIVIAHRLSTVKNVDKIYVLHEGEIVEEGKHDSLIAANGTYKKLYDLQMFS